MADWDVGRFPHLHDWVTARLAQDYPALRAPELGPGMPRLLAERGAILPILDGLDELAPSAHAAVIMTLNRSLGDSDQLILTSRTTEFVHAVETAGDVLTSALVIEPESLTPATATGYLRRCLPRRLETAWEPVLAGLRSASPSSASAALAEVVGTPLGLWLLRSVYITPGTEPAPLLDADRFPDARAFAQPSVRPAHRRAHHHPATHARPRRDLPAPPPARPVQTRRWLAFLAHQLSTTPAGQAAGTRDFAWWRLAGQMPVITAKTALKTAVVIGVNCGLALGFAVGQPAGPKSGLIAALTSGSLVGFLIMLWARRTLTSWSQDSPGFADLRRPRRPSPNSARSRSSALKVGLGGGFIVGLGEATIGLIWVFIEPRILFLVADEFQLDRGSPPGSCSG